MSKESRETGKALRKVEKLDKAWRADGCKGGPKEDRLDAQLREARARAGVNKTYRMMDRD